MAAKGGVVIAESCDTAMMAGIPDEAIRTGVVSEIAPLGQIPEVIARKLREA